MADANPVAWRLVLCDLWGNALAIINTIASDVQLTYGLNRPAILSFSVPSDSPLVNNLYMDTDQVWLDVGRRIVKAYRKKDVSLPAGYTGFDNTWDLKYVGIVWDIGDDGDSDSTRTAVTCYDPMYHLSKRVVRRIDGSKGSIVYMGNKHADQIVHDLIHRSNENGASPTFVNVADATFHTCTAQTVSYDPGSDILSAIITLCDTGLIDVVPTYLDVSDGTRSLPHPYHMQLGAKPRRGSTVSKAVLGYAGPPRNSSEYHRTRSMGTFANDVDLWGKSTHGHHYHDNDTDSVNSYGSYEHAEVLTDIETSVLVNSLGSEMLFLCKDPRDLVSFIPVPEKSAAPFDDYTIGDLIKVNAASGGLNPETRDHLNGLQRVYGFQLSVDDDYGEKVTQMICSSQDLGSDTA